VCVEKGVRFSLQQLANEGLTDTVVLWFVPCHVN